jgi:DNA-directed RNA polymerase subunit RPC12/RpoP
MFVTMQKPKCSKCGSDRYEDFSNIHNSGVRCLSCGHVGDVKEHHPYKSTPTTTYIYDTTKDVTF